MWVEAFEAKFEGKGKKYGRDEFDQLLGHCMAVTDWPAVSFSDELIEAYPEAKVILTTRDSPEAWERSVLDTNWTGNFQFGPPKSTLQLLVQTLFAPPSLPALRKVYQHSILKDDSPEHGKEGYIQYNEHIRSVMPNDRLLEFNVKEGCVPLCAFLEVPVPDQPFPRVNDTKSWHQYAAMQRREALQALLGRFAVALASAGVTSLAIYLAIMRW